MDSATKAVINYLGKLSLNIYIYSNIYKLEQRAEVDRVHLKDKSTCSSDAFIRWEEVNKNLIE